MNSSFAPYEGGNSYIFVSYAHADAGRVLPIIKNLHDRHYRIWYDNGIEAGANWPEVIARHLSNASRVLFFVSKNFLLSHNCAREVNFTVEMKISMAVFYLDTVELLPGMRMQLSEAVSVKADAIGNPNGEAEALINTGAIQDEFIGDGLEGYINDKKKGRRKLNVGLVVGVVGIVLALCSLAVLLGVTQGWFSGGDGGGTKVITVFDNAGEAPEVFEVTTWTNTVMRDLLITQVDSEALYTCGKAFVTSRDAITYSDGKYRVAGEAAERGDISDLEVIAQKTQLIELTLCRQAITDVSALKGMVQLKYLDISGNELTNLLPLAELDNLTTLKLCHSNLTDLTATLEMASLQKLYISFDMVEYAENILGGGFDIIVTE